MWKFLILVIGVILVGLLVYELWMQLCFQLACGKSSAAIKKLEQKFKKVKTENENILNERMEGIRWLCEMHPTEQIIMSRDGLKLKGHLLEQENAERVVIFFHGWHGKWDKDGGAFAKKLYENHCNVLLVEQRAHGDSEGKYIGYGLLEKYDCAKWAKQMSKKYHELPIYLAGVSMGAATVLMASGLNLSVRVKGIIADCGFTSPYEMVCIFAKKYAHIKNMKMVEKINRMCCRKAGYDLKEATTLENMDQCNIPILFFHGNEDDFVPEQMSEENYEHCAAKKEIIIVDQAAHARSFLVQPDLYMEEIRRFFWNSTEESALEQSAN